MVRDLRKTHLRNWLLIGPLLFLVAAATLLTRPGPAIPDAPPEASTPTPVNTDEPVSDSEVAP